MKCGMFWGTYSWYTVPQAGQTHNRHFLYIWVFEKNQEADMCNGEGRPVLKIKASEIKNNIV
jgi:hypothetical protein